MDRAFTCVCTCVSVCLSVCPRSKRKTASATKTKLGTHILCSSLSAYIDPEVKGQRSSSHGYETVTVARLLVTMAGNCAAFSCATCDGCRRGSACRYDRLRFLVFLYFILRILQCSNHKCVIFTLFSLMFLLL